MMANIYQAKLPFRGLTKEQRIVKDRCDITTITRSTPTSPNANIRSSQLSKYNAHYTKLADEILRSPILNVKMEKCSSEPNVSKDVVLKRNTVKMCENITYPLSASASSQNGSRSDDSLTAISITHVKEHNNLFLTFEEGELFEVLSKEEHKNWWAVCSIKSGIAGFVPANLLIKPEDGIKKDLQLAEPELNLVALTDLRRRVAAALPAGTVFPDGDAMIPEPELCAPGVDLEKRNRRNQPPAPPLPPPLSAEGLILPRKPLNPCLESTDHKSLHRELLFNQKTGKNVLNQKSELQRAFGKHKEQQVRKELEQQKQSNKTDLERMIEERARRMDLKLEKSDEEVDKCLRGEPEFLKVHAKMRARMDSK